jgi:hypothetical protein
LTINFRSLSFTLTYQRNKSKLFYMTKKERQENRTDPNIHTQEAPNSDSPQDLTPLPSLRPVGRAPRIKRFTGETQREKIFARGGKKPLAMGTSSDVHFVSQMKREVI